MCAITASFSKVTLQELYKLNSYRGELSYSLGTFNYRNVSILEILSQKAGKMDESVIRNIPATKGSYFVAHSQAPTTNTNNIHPAIIQQDGGMLWHNGIIKQKELPKDTWDTEWLLKQILDNGWEILSDIDGTFACIMYYDNNLFVFRNEISPLFVDNKLNISSTKFENSTLLPPNLVFKINLKDKLLEEVSIFKTKENPYYLASTL